MLFENKKELEVSMGEGTKIKDLIEELKNNYIKENPDLFYIEGGLRPGVLVLINDTDWELEGEEEYLLVSNDKICFISTLHGG